MKYIAILFSIFILWVIVNADHGTLPPFIKAVYDFPNGDRVGHFILFGLLNFFLSQTFLRALPNRSPKRVVLSTGLILAVLIGAEEFSQRYFLTRTFDLIDLSMSYLGLIVGGWIALKLKKQVTLQA